MKRKAIFLDIDGTLVNRNGEVPPSAREALCRAGKKGHELVLCSGRSRFQIPESLLELGFSGIVAATGAYVTAGDELIFHACIDEEHRRSSYTYLEGNGFIFFYQAAHAVLINPRCYEGMLEIYRELGMSARNTEQLASRMRIVEEPWRDPGNEKIVYHKGPFPLQQVQRELKPYFDTAPLSFADRGGLAGEIGISGISKATGMAQYLSHAGLTREDTVGIGDGPNDLDMIEYAGVGVAMGNALPDVKERADLVTDHIDADGLYRAFETLGLL